MNTLHRGVRGVVVALVLASALGGCASARQRRIVSIRFQTLHSCEAETVQSTESGYVITGCGIETHYACLDADPFPLLTGSRMRCVETRVNDGSTQAPSRQVNAIGPPKNFTTMRTKDAKQNLNQGRP